MTPRLSIIMPAYNEEGNLQAAVRGMADNLEKVFQDYEIVIINDGSHDRTGEIAEQLAHANGHLRVRHHEKNRGLGASYQTGVLAAQGSHVCYIPADNEIVPDSMAAIFQEVGTADILVAHGAKENVRPWIRRTLSKLWTRFLNTLFGFNLKYYNGPNVYKRELLTKLPLQTDSFAFQAVNLIQCLQRGATYKEVTFRLQPRTHGETKIFRLKNVVESLKAILKLFLGSRVFSRYK